MKKTIVELDLKGYSDTARELEEHFSADVVLKFNDQIQSFVDGGLNTAGAKRENAVLATTGDGAIVMFDDAPMAHVFAEAVHRATRLHNHGKTIPGAKRWFRIGIATGNLAIEETDGKRKMGGSVIARAVRLETAANVGAIVADEETYAELSADQRACYGDTEKILGKRDEEFGGRCYPVITGPSGNPPIPGACTCDSRVKKNVLLPARSGDALKRWQDKLDFLQSELATAIGLEERYKIKCQIKDAKDMIIELGG